MTAAAEVFPLDEHQMMALRDALDVLSDLPPIIDIPAFDGGRVGPQAHVGTAAAIIATLIRLDDASHGPT